MTGLAWGAATDHGLVRPHNEDAVLAQPPVFAVADGMGGHEAGEVASGIAIEHLRDLVDTASLAVPDIARAITSANSAIVVAAREKAECAGMGTTVVGLVAVEQHGTPYWVAFNVGDSRLYRLAQGDMTQISVDHSYVQELVTSGRLSAEAAREHPERNVITRALGADAVIEPDFWLMPREPGERFLLCSDGLSGDLDEEAIQQLLGSPGEPAEAANNLVAAAIAAGGNDNITVIVIDVHSGGGYGALETTLPRGTASR